MIEQRRVQAAPGEMVFALQYTVSGTVLTVLPGKVKMNAGEELAFMGASFDWSSFPTELAFGILVRPDGSPAVHLEVVDPTQAARPTGTRLFALRLVAGASWEDLEGVWFTSAQPTVQS